MAWKKSHLLKWLATKYYRRWNELDDLIQLDGRFLTRKEHNKRFCVISAERKVESIQAVSFRVDKATGSF